MQSFYTPLLHGDRVQQAIHETTTKRSEESVSALRSPTTKRIQSGD